MGFSSLFLPILDTSADATLEDLHMQNIQLRDLLEKACHQMQCNFALKKLMNKENGDLREQFFCKKKKPPKRFSAATTSRHMTLEEALEALAYEEWKLKWIEVKKSFKRRLRTIAKDKKADEEKQRQANKEERKRQKEIRDTQKELEQQEKEQWKVEKGDGKSTQGGREGSNEIKKKATTDEKKHIAPAENERREKEKQKKGTGKKKLGMDTKKQATRRAKRLEEDSDSQEDFGVDFNGIDSDTKLPATNTSLPTTTSSP
ncbi:hypothetical protein K435DRAFT_856175 [Dendrothele bispora CBS 962.96]|uniref:Uncharacterized protein n=1 Tax=Dendrothele bispora (strain CBS 962.96) TaxID=1314807 RepID=A0A4S8L3R6_DENBC|nr:hypothetical protein K435DRAFT_871803 [Dendrothele bispora CBS 962.96]THU98942.1 hypothetical protein K435DRAFT_856175 [Dendrothele bispora CBS 962.96]